MKWWGLLSQVNPWEEYISLTLSIVLDKAAMKLTLKKRQYLIERNFYFIFR
jgi:hypothetical protein